MTITTVSPSVPTAIPLPSFEHLLALSDGIGTFEHADHAVARHSHGYCTDDMARLLVVIAREPQRSAAVNQLGRTAMRFLVEATGVAGHVRNRRNVGGRWRGKRGVEDCWGRAVWAFGTAANRGEESWLRDSGLSSFERTIEQRSGWRRASAFAALGAAEVLAGHPQHYGARRVLAEAIDTIGGPAASPQWPWPEERLTYANAVLPEALLAAGQALERADVVEDGVELLSWLLERETASGHYSPTPVGGAGPGDRAPRFDQQAIEAAAMADACARAEAVTGDPVWGRGVDLAVGWFLGENDVGAVMWDPETGGGYDGLHARGPNRNQGAESTIALVATLQLAQRRLAARA